MYNLKIIHGYWIIFVAVMFCVCFLMKLQPTRYFKKLKIYILRNKKPRKQTKKWKFYIMSDFLRVFLCYFELVICGCWSARPKKRTAYYWFCNCEEVMESCWVLVPGSKVGVHIKRPGGNLSLWSLLCIENSRLMFLMRAAENWPLERPVEAISGDAALVALEIPRLKGPWERMKHGIIWLGWSHWRNTDNSTSEDATFTD